MQKLEFTNNQLRHFVTDFCIRDWAYANAAEYGFGCAGFGFGFGVDSRIREVNNGLGRGPVGSGDETFMIDSLSVVFDLPRLGIRQYCRRLLEVEECAPQQSPPARERPLNLDGVIDHLNFSPCGLLWWPVGSGMNGRKKC